MERLSPKTILARAWFGIQMFVKMATPPLYSFDRLEKFFRKEIGKNPTAYLPRLFLADLYVHYVKYPEARKEFGVLLEQGYKRNSVLKPLGEVCVRLKDFSAAIKYLEQIESRDHDDKYFNYYVGASYVGIDECEKALPYLLRAEQLSSKKSHLLDFTEEYRFPKSHLYKSIGYCFSKIGQFERSAEFYRKALSLDPNSAEVRESLAIAHLNAGIMLQKQGNLQRAVEEYKRAVEIRPDHYDALVDLTQMCLSLGSFEEAVNYGNKMIDLKPSDPRGYALTAIVLIQSGAARRAIEICEKGLKILPDHESLRSCLEMAHKKLS